MISVQEFWIIIGLTAIVALLLGAGVGYLLLPKSEENEEPKTKPKVKAKEQNKTKERIRKMYQLITDLTVTLNYSRVLEKSLDAAFLALKEFPIFPRIG